MLFALGFFCLLEGNKGSRHLRHTLKKKTYLAIFSIFFVYKLCMFGMSIVHLLMFTFKRLVNLWLQTMSTRMP